MSLFYVLEPYIFHILAGPVCVAVNPPKPAHESYWYELFRPQMAPNVAYEPPELKYRLRELFAL